jgi:hypothetical protein
MKKRLILILNGKGGVGKSFFAVHFVQYLKDHQIAHAAFDSDDENSTLKRFHPEVGFINPNSPVEIDRMVEALKDTDVVVVDSTPDALFHRSAPLSTPQVQTEAQIFGPFGTKCPFG